MWRWLVAAVIVGGGGWYLADRQGGIVPDAPAPSITSPPRGTSPTPPPLPAPLPQPSTKTAEEMARSTVPPFTTLAYCAANAPTTAAKVGVAPTCRPRSMPTFGR